MAWELPQGKALETSGLRGGSGLSSNLSSVEEPKDSGTSLETSFPSLREGSPTLQEALAPSPLAALASEFTPPHDLSAPVVAPAGVRGASSFPQPHSDIPQPPSCA